MARYVVAAGLVSRKMVTSDRYCREHGEGRAYDGCERDKLARTRYHQRRPARRAGRLWQRCSDGRCAAERVACGFRHCRGDTLCDRGRHRSTIHSCCDAAQHRDPERAPEFRARLRDRRRHSRPLRWSHADNQIGGHREHRRQAKRQRDVPRHGHQRPIRVTDQCEDCESGGGDDEATGEHMCDAEPSDEQRRHRRTGDERDSRWRGPQSRLHRRHPKHELQYCAMRRNAPNPMKKPRILMANPAANARERNSDRSISGTVNVC